MSRPSLILLALGALLSCATALPELSRTQCVSAIADLVNSAACATALNRGQCFAPGCLSFAESLPCGDYSVLYLMEQREPAAFTKL